MSVASWILPIFEVRDGFRMAFRSLDQLMSRGKMIDVLWLTLSMIVAWFIYTPIHELLHVAGCRLTGGTVTELALAPEYGAHLLKKIFPFIHPESNYAGQLTGFTTPSRLSYFVTDMLPYVLSLFGLPVLHWATQKKWVWLAGLGYLLAFIPFMSIPGDLYEAVSLYVSPFGELITYPGLEGYLISDDVFLLIKSLQETGQWTRSNISLVIIILLGAIYMACQLLALQVRLLRLMKQDKTSK